MLVHAAFLLTALYVKADAKPLIPYAGRSIWGPQLYIDQTQHVIPDFSHRAAPISTITSGNYAATAALPYPSYVHPITQSSGHYQFPFSHPNLVYINHQGLPLVNTYGFMYQPQKTPLSQDGTQRTDSGVAQTTTYRIQFPQAVYHPPTRINVPYFASVHDQQIPKIKNSEKDSSNAGFRDATQNNIAAEPNENKILVADFPTELDGPKFSLRFENIEGEEENYFKAPAGIAQSTQPKFSWINFKNSKASQFLFDDAIPVNSPVILE